MWDEKAPRLITQARLLTLPAEAVYRELQHYGAYLEGQILGGDDRELEQALLRRDDPLITLGLAMFGGSRDVCSSIYKNALSAGGDAQYKRALRLAILGNRVLPKIHLLASHYAFITDAEASRIAKSGDGDEVNALLQNPSAKRVLSDLFNRKFPFDDMPEERFMAMVRLTSSNPALTDDNSNRHGPDMTAWDIQKGILNLLRTAPVNEHAIDCLHPVLSALDPSQVRTPDEDPTPILERWRSLKVSDDFAEWHKEYGDTQLTYQEEFCCLIAALYGAYYVEKKSKCVGRLDSPDIVLRCAYYGHEKMTLDEMSKAHEQDESAFTFAALKNTSLFFDMKARSKLEDLLEGRLIHYYRRHCEQIQKRYKDFNPKPISDMGVLDNEDAAEGRKPSPESVAYIGQPPDEEKPGIVSLAFSVIGSVVVLLVAFGIFNSATTKFETITISVLLLIYLAVENSLASIVRSIVHLDAISFDRFIKLRTASGIPAYPQETASLQKMQSNLRQPGAKYWIKQITNGIIWLLIVYKLFVILF